MRTSPSASPRRRMASVPVPDTAPPAPVTCGPGRAECGRCSTARRSGGGAGAASGRDGRATGSGQRRAAEDERQRAAVLAGTAVTGGDRAGRAGRHLRATAAGRGGGRILLVLAGDAVVIGVQPLGVTGDGVVRSLGLGLAGEVGAVAVGGGIGRAGGAEGQDGGDEDTGGGAAAHGFSREAVVW